LNWPNELYRAKDKKLFIYDDPPEYHDMPSGLYRSEDGSEVTYVRKGEIHNGMFTIQASPRTPSESATKFQWPQQVKCRETGGKFEFQYEFGQGKCATYTYNKVIWKNEIGTRYDVLQMGSPGGQGFAGTGVTTGGAGSGNIGSAGSGAANQSCCTQCGSNTYIYQVIKGGTEYCSNCPPKIPTTSIHGQEVSVGEMTMPTFDGHQDFGKALEENLGLTPSNVSQCECGAEAVGGSKHSDWCPMYVVEK